MKLIRKITLFMLMMGFILHSNAQGPYLFGQFNMQGNTVPDPANPTICYRLTAAQTNNLGTIWTQNTIDLTCPFILPFNLFFGSGGADGMCFIIQNNSNTYLGPTTSGGGGLGYLGMTNSFAIEFDTYQNSGTTYNNGSAQGQDATSNHMCFFKNGSLLHNSADQLAPPVNIPSWVMENGVTHSVVISWNPTTQNLSCVFDNNALYTISTTVNLPAIIGSNTVYYGFSAATGGEVNVQKVCPLTNNPTILPPQNELGCAGTGYNFDASSLGTGTYTWSPMTNLAVTGPGLATANPMVSTDYTLTFTDPCGFQTIKHFIIDANATPTVDLGLPVSVCPGSTAVITPTGNFDNILDWTVDGVSTGTTTPTFTANGGTTVGVTVNLNGCSSNATDNVAITEVSLQPFTAGNDYNNCVPTGTSVVYTGASAQAGFGISWTTVDGNIVSGANTINPTVDASGTYTLTVSGGNGCTDTDDVLITLVSNPSVNLGNDFVHCGTGNFTLTVTGSYDLITWGDGSTGANFTSNVGGTYDVTVDIAGCTANDQIIVTQVIPPIPDAGTDILTCTNGSVNLAATADPSYTYNWTTADGNIINGATTLTPLVGLSGTYTLTITSPDNCTATDDILVTLVPIPSVNLGSNIQICPGDPFIITVPNASSYDLITWGDASTGPTFNSTGPQTVDVEVEINGCTNTDQLVVTEYNAPNWNLGGDLTVCGDAPFSYTTGLSVTWFDGTTGTSYSNPPAGTLSATYYYGNNCPLTDDVQITIIAPTQIELGNDTLICEGTSLILDAGVPVSWNGVMGLTSNTYEAIQPNLYTAYFTDGYCIDFDTIQISVQPLPVINWQEDQTYCEGTPVVMANPNSNATDFYWSTGAITEEITIVESGYYTLTVSNFCGSAFEDILIDFVECSAFAYIPNAFTPDQDGVNEAWQPIIGNAIEYEMFIFNRWGDQVFHSKDPNENWMGETHNGLYYSPDGLYTYRLILKSPDASIKEYFGNFHLLR
jgi:gliding motility-associated-like protein